MKFAHNGLQIELNDDWWAEAGMDNFVPTSCSYRVAQTNQQVHEVLIDEVGPVQRGAGVGIFNDSIEEGSARDRVIRILRGFRLGEPIPPVEIVAQRAECPHRYKLVHGAHRFYCSLAAGFTHVPTVSGFDWNTINQ